MADMVPALLVLVALLDATALYAVIVGRRTHQRRIDQRLRASAYLYGLVRVTLADRRTA
jgi:hypothetical protein